VCDRIIGIGADRAFIRRDRGIQIARLEGEIAQVGKRRRKCRLELDRGDEVGAGEIAALQTNARDAALVEQKGSRVAGFASGEQL